MLQIKGLQKTSLIDYPGKIACTVFLAGCNFRCGFCHNRVLVLNPDKLETISEEEFFEFLDKRNGKLDGVVICGGEPCFSDGLIEHISKIKSKEFLVKLDTNGSFPDILKHLIDKKLIDYVAMDVKYPIERYKEHKESIKESINIIINSDINSEFRCTVVPRMLNEYDIINIAKELKNGKKFVLQQFKNEKCIDKKFEKIVPFPTEKLEEIRIECNKYIKTEIRN